MFSRTVEVAVSVHEKDGIYERELTKNAHDVLALPHGVQDLLVATLDRRLLRKVYLRRPLIHGIRDVLQPRDARDGHEVEKEATEPRRAEVPQEGGDFSRP